MKSCVTISLVPEARGGPFVFWDDLQAACQTAGQLGFDAVEIFAPGPDAVDRATLRKLLADNNLQLAAVGTGAGWVKHRLHLALPDAASRQQAIDFICSMIDFGAEFNAPAIIGSMQGRSSPEVDRPAARRLLVDALQLLGEHAGQQGSILLYEPLNRYETDQCTLVADGCQLLREVGGSQVKLLCDLFHMNIEEIDPAAALRAAGDAVGHIHFVDTTRRAVGFGHYEMASVIRALREINFTGYLSAEAFPLPDPQTAAAQTLRAFRYYTTA